jgi:hypothetical protein
VRVGVDDDVGEAVAVRDGVKLGRPRQSPGCRPAGRECAYRRR